MSGFPDCEGLLSSYVLGALFYILSKYSSTELSHGLPISFLDENGMKISPEIFLNGIKSYAFSWKPPKKIPGKNARKADLARAILSEWGIVWQIEGTEIHRLRESNWQKEQISDKWILFKRPLVYMLQLCSLVLLWDSWQGNMGRFWLFYWLLGPYLSWVVLPSLNTWGGA